MNDQNHSIYVWEEAGKLLASCVLVLVPNLTREQRPYGLIENVITHPDHRRKGYAKKLLEHAKTAAAQAGCYKLMLMTGSKDEGVFRLYEEAGFNREDKTAFVQWMNL